tara:strand:- start:1569 stop:2420 length:852 start_codon:yes stop_codon:yes gene_type:complete
MNEEIANSEEPVVDSNDGASSSNSFLDTVEDQYRNDPSVSKFESVNDLAKEHVNLQSLLGRKGVIIPTEEDGSEAWTRFRKDMGIPDSHENYSKKDFEAPSDIGWDSDFEVSMAEAAHKLNINDTQFSGLLNAYAANLSDSVEKVESFNEEAFEQSQSVLKKEWGAAYEANVNIGISALSHVTDGKPEALAEVALADGTMLGNNSNFIKAMSSIGKQFQERGLINGESINTSTMSPDEAKSKLSQIMADPEKSEILFSQEFHPSKDELVKERERLLSFAYPED